jgi:hypothetical protein
MKNIRKPAKVVSAEQISRLAERGEDVSRFFTNSGSIIGPIKRPMKTVPTGSRPALSRKQRT